LIKDCRTIIVAKRSRNKRETNDVTHELYAVALLVNNKLDSTWYIDSRSTQHICYELEGFINYTKHENNQVVYLGDDSTLYTIKGCNDVNAKLLIGNKKIILECKLNLDLYELGTTITCNAHKIAIPSTTNLNKDNLWHLRLVYINQQRLKEI